MQAPASSGVPGPGESNTPLKPFIVQELRTLLPPYHTGTILETLIRKDIQNLRIYTFTQTPVYGIKKCGIVCQISINMLVHVK